MALTLITGNDLAGDTTRALPHYLKIVEASGGQGAQASPYDREVVSKFAYFYGSVAELAVAAGEVTP